MKKWISLLLALVLMLGAVSAAAAEDGSVIGAAEGSAYTNEFFGFRIDLPEDWWFLDDSQMASVLGYDSASGSREGLMALLEQQSAVCVMFASCYTDTTASMNFMVEDLGNYQALSEETYRELSRGSLEQALTAQGFANVKVEAKTFPVSGRELIGFAITGSVGDFTLYMVDILIKVDRYMGVLTISTSAEDSTYAAVDFLKLL